MDDAQRPLDCGAFERPRRVAIACQGGGSHTAFTAGVLARLLRCDHPIVALSGTSGGAICAVIAWYAMLVGNRAFGASMLKSFWQANAAASPFDWMLNQWLVLTQRLMPGAEIGPYHMPNFATDELRRLIEAQVRFADIKRLWRADSPRLFIAAVDVLNGAFRVFRDREITVDSVLASAAVPPLFRAVEIGEAGATRYYWDGLLSQNPPIRDLPDAFGRHSPLNPEEIWIIQINPDSRPSLPMGTGDIIDRRNELAGNLSLRQEIDVIRLINGLCAQGCFPDARYRPVTLRRIVLDRDDLDYPSKLDRAPEFIAELMRQGERAAERFLAEPQAHRIDDPAPAIAAA